ncbi:MAG: caspase family protein [Saprospiraceae bacterium]|nr:caspase family protein [Saprospiraceae bacterium]
MERGIFSPDNTSLGAPSGKNFLLAIGIDKYKNWPALNNAVKDAQDVTNVLVKHYQFEADHVISLFDEQATEANIYETIRILKRKITPDDNLLIYYSGHGHYDDEFDEGAWVPVDAKQETEDGYIKNVNIIHKLNAIDSHHTLLIVDSCFSGTLVVRKRAAIVDERFKSRRILAAGRNATVSDGQAGTNSPFALGILTFLRKNTDKAIKTTQLIEYVKDFLQTKARQTPVEGRLQNSHDEGGEFVFHLKMSESDLWQNVVRSDSLAGYQNYLDTYPEGQFAAAAERKILEISENDIWKSATIKATAAAYENYIRKYPAGTFLAEARKQLKLLQDARDKRKAVLEELAAQASERAGIRQQFDSLITKAESHFQQRELSEAKDAYQQAQLFFLEGFVPDLKYIDDQLVFCANGIRFLNHYEQGKGYLKQNNYRLALEYFKEAQTVDDNPKLEDLIRYCRLKLHESTPGPIIEEEIQSELNPVPLPQRLMGTSNETVKTDQMNGQQPATNRTLSSTARPKRKKSKISALLIASIIGGGILAAYQLYQENQLVANSTNQAYTERSTEIVQPPRSYTNGILGEWTLRDLVYDGQSIRNTYNSNYQNLLNTTITFGNSNQMQYYDSYGQLRVANYYINDQNGAITIRNYLGGLSGTIQNMNRRRLVIGFIETDAYGVQHQGVLTFAR